jgi:hypothetical protein
LEDAFASRALKRGDYRDRDCRRSIDAPLL